MADRPAHPPIQAKHPGRPAPAPHLQAEHDRAMRRQPETLHLAKHCLGGVKREHRHHSEKMKGDHQDKQDQHSPEGSPADAGQVHR